jgi:hypothetical protein
MLTTKKQTIVGRPAPEHHTPHNLKPKETTTKRQQKEEEEEQQQQHFEDLNFFANENQRQQY